MGVDVEMTWNYEDHGASLGMDRNLFDSMKRSFEIYDNDGSGHIDLPEFSALMNAIGMKMSEFLGRTRLLCC